jgi:hypothetical protein
MWVGVKIRKLLSTFINDDVIEWQHSHNASTFVQWYTPANPVFIVILSTKMNTTVIQNLREYPPQSDLDGYIFIMLI